MSAQKFCYQNTSRGEVLLSTAPGPLYIITIFQTQIGICDAKAAKKWIIISFFEDLTGIELLKI